MIKKCIRTIFLVSIIAINMFVLAACGSNSEKKASSVDSGQQSGKSEEKPKELTAEETVNKILQLRKDGKLEEFVNLIWPKYLEIQNVTKEQLINSIKDADFKSSFVLKDYRVSAVTDFDKDIKKATVSLKYTDSSGQEKTGEDVFALIKEDGTWKVSLSGVIDKKDYNYENITLADGKLSMLLTREIKKVQGSSLRIKVVNKSNIDFALGWVEGAKAIVDTDKGQFIATINQGTKIAQGLDDYLNIDVQNMSGTIKQVKITSIFALQNGLPNPSDKGIEAVVYKQ
ncbi:hypothetical protein [Clostridium folliculivorans]|uniref:hypothetical protein n=1 Tax=Clostridium folliculivorans TaxID=2886038 RepID=UPI0021C2E0DB|nr:hypothetical protein [Clostridium folliculivorans]GKU29326.1 hypothetical protein CFB3_14320 [Clostridium folliculivorans]